MTLKTKNHKRPRNMYHTFIGHFGKRLFAFLQNAKHHKKTGNSERANLALSYGNKKNPTCPSQTH